MLRLRVVVTLVHNRGIGLKGKPIPRQRFELSARSSPGPICPERYARSQEV